MATIDDQEFEEEFSTFGVNVEDSNVYDKLRHLCQIHRLKCEEIVCEWLAFAQNKHNVKLSEEMLEVMDRERLAKKQTKHTKTPSSIRTKGASYNINALEGIGDAVDSVLDSYTTPNNKGNAAKRQHTPDNPVNKRLTNNGRNPIPFSPASFSPTQSATPSRNFSNRSNAGQVVCSLGTADNTKWASKRDSAPAVVNHEASHITLTNKFKYMFQKLSDKANVLSDMIDEMGEYLKKKHNVEDDFAHIALPVQEPVSVVGRVSCDTVGKLNAKSVMLEGSRETSAGNMIPLDLTEVPQFSLFPGQIVAAEGINTTGCKFVTKKIYEGVTLPFSEKPVDLSEGPLSMVIAAGPFTTSDSIMYEPLTDLVKYLHKETPDICVLMGPFVDSKQPNIEDAITEMSFEMFFQETIVKVLAEQTSRLKTKLIFVPSFRDVHHEYVYPQPPFSVKVDSKKVQFVSDPCTLDIDGVVFGFTSTDVLFHLGQEETSSSTAGDRLTRLTQHILTQHNYYPLHPPHEDMNLDYEQFELHGHMPCTPHVFVLPSDLRYFVKDIQGCCCINPGRLAKGQVGGTYARLLINPGSNSNVSTAKSISNQISAQVLRI